MAISDGIVRIRNRYKRLLSKHGGKRVVHVRLKTPIISFTFDDFPQSAAREGGAILTRNGLCGTFYVSLGLMDREIPAGLGFSRDDLERVVAEGHELGCHTFDHCDAWETSPGAFEESIITNGRILEKLLPGTTLKTLSYPIDCPRPQTKRRAARYFACSRAGGQTFNVGKTDANSLQAFFLEKSRSNPGEVEVLIDENRNQHGWLIFATHDVSRNPTPFGCTPEFFERIVRFAGNSGSRILPVSKAWECLRAEA